MVCLLLSHVPADYCINNMGPLTAAMSYKSC